MSAAQDPGATPDGASAVGPGSLTEAPLLEVREVSKYFGSVNALQGISLQVYPGEVTCVLGDNGAGKSTLIKILSGVFQPDAGEFLFEGRPVTLAGPREARSHGIATVFQDLATIPLMSLWRNFFLGQEPTSGRGPLRHLDSGQARTIMREELKKMGIDVRDPNQNVGTLSGGERQALAIARAVYFGAKVLILDEPTSALGVRQSGIVLKYIVQARELGKGVIFITHNPHHAYPVGDRFYLLKRGRLMASVRKDDTTVEGLTEMMAGGTELKELSQELLALTAGTSGAEASGVAEVARELAEEAPAGEAPDPALGAFPDSALLRFCPVTGAAGLRARSGRVARVRLMPLLAGRVRFRRQHARRPGRRVARRPPGTDPGTAAATAGEPGRRP